MILIFSFKNILTHIKIRILEERPNHKYDNNADWECRNNRYRLQAIHGILCKNQTNWKKYEHIAHNVRIIL